LKDGQAELPPKIGEALEVAGDKGDSKRPAWRVIRKRLEIVGPELPIGNQSRWRGVMQSFLRVSASVRELGSTQTSRQRPVPYALFRKSFGYSNKARARMTLEQPIQQRPARRNARTIMQDVWMLLFTVVFFGLAFLYVKACQKLR
jgi:hypothetical protein